MLFIYWLCIVCFILFSYILFLKSLLLSSLLLILLTTTTTTARRRRRRSSSSGSSSSSSKRFIFIIICIVIVNFYKLEQYLSKNNNYTIYVFLGKFYNSLHNKIKRSMKVYWKVLGPTKIRIFFSLSWKVKET